MISLRAQHDDDVPVLVELAQRAWRDVERAVDALLGSPLDRLVTPSWAAHHEAVVRGAAAAPETTVVVAEDDTGTVVGFVAYRLHPASEGMSEYGEIEVVGVDPDARRRGIGRLLVDRAVEDLRRAGAPVIMVASGGDEGHAPARALYECAGFRQLPLVQYWLVGAEEAGRG